MMPQHVDLQYLNEISGGSRELLIEMIEIFNSEVPGYLKLMNDFYEKGNWEALGKLAHKAKASASIMGMKQLTTELREIELLAQDERDIQSYPTLLHSIENKFIAAMEELKLFAKTL
jgi:HPt (histidine-containing phosphotransfer) domain-containing protein